MPEEIQVLASSFLELTPGVSANPGNLKTLLSTIMRTNGWYKSSDEMGVGISIIGLKKKPKLFVYLEGQKLGTRGYDARPRLMARQFPATEDGLLEAIVLLKKTIRKYRIEGTCEACEPRTKRLKADGMPKCEACVLTEAVGF